MQFPNPSFRLSGEAWEFGKASGGPAGKGRVMDGVEFEIEPFQGYAELEVCKRSLVTLEGLTMERKVPLAHLHHPAYAEGWRLRFE